MASRTFTQYRSGTQQQSSNPESTLLNYVSNYKDYISVRTGSSESIIVIGDYQSPGRYSDCDVYLYDSTSRTITHSEYDNVTLTIYQNYYVRGNLEGIPGIPNYQSESNIAISLLLFLSVSIWAVSSLLKHFWRLVRCRI